LLRFRGFLESIGIEVKHPTKTFCDNSPAVTLTHDGNHLKRSKHYVVRTAFLKEQVEIGVIEVEHIKGILNHADLLTKALSGRLLRAHTAGILGLSAEFVDSILWNYEDID